MADNFLERHREEYEIRKAAWLKKKNKYSSRKVKKERNMADNFLERHREEYEIRKAAWLKKKKLFMKSGKKQKPQTQMPRPEDEAL